MGDFRTGDHEILTRLCDLGHKMVSGMTKMRADRGRYIELTVYLGLAVRMCRLFRSFSILLEEGYGIEAQMIERAFFETLVDLAYIETDPSTLTTRYLKYEAAAHLQFARNHKRDSDAKQYVREHGDTVESFCHDYGITSGKLPGHWSGKPMKQRAEEIGLDNYYRIYSWHSSLLHNSPLALQQYINLSKLEVITLCIEPNSTIPPGLMDLMCLGYLFHLGRFNEQFNLAYENELETIVLEVRKYLGIDENGVPGEDR